MPTNVPPQYRKAEDRFREAITTPAKIAALQEMMTIMPNHKGTNHLRAQQRAKLSELMGELEGESKGSGRSEPFSLSKQGAGRATLIGPTNVGKSALVVAATGANSNVGAYALSTQEPVPGMLPFEDIHVQLVDTPPITHPATQGRLYGLLRNTDVFVVVVDLSMDVVEQTCEVFGALKEWGFVLLGKDDDPDEENPELSKPTIIVGNKADINGALDQYEVLEEAYSDTYPVIMASAEEEVGIDDLSEEVFRALDIIRVYTKSPRDKLEDVTKTDPFVLPFGSTVEEAADRVHKDIGRNLKYAVLWGSSGQFDAQRVGRTHALVDGDVVELHT